MNSRAVIQALWNFEQETSNLDHCVFVSNNQAAFV